MIRGTIFLENIESQEEIYGNANIVLSVSSTKTAHSAKKRSIRQGILFLLCHKNASNTWSTINKVVNLQPIQTITRNCYQQFTYQDNH